jgi:hypothetical protein
MRWLPLLLAACTSPHAPPSNGSGDNGKGDGTATMVDAAPPPAGIWQPHPGTSWQWQLSGTIDTSFDVAMYDIDMFDAPQATIDSLHAAGRVVICYFSAGTYENWRPDAAMFPASIIGSAVVGWPGENWLDTRSSTVRDLMSARLDRAVAKHCDGVEPDNVDGYQNNPGFPLDATTQLDYNRFLAGAAHSRGLSVGLKNDIDQIPDLLAAFDWELDEQCFQFNECDQLAPFVNAGKAAFEVEYGTSSLVSSVCPRANAANLDTLIKDMNLTATRISCR